MRSATRRPAAAIRVDRRGTRDRSVEVRVADTGSGIAADELPRIFDRFYRVDKSRPTGSSSGIGLGLAIVKRILTLHGSTIEVDSTLAKGTEFRFLLPSYLASANSGKIVA